MNFISETDLNLENDVEVVGKIISYKKFLGSWIINYEMMEIDSTAKEQIQKEAEEQAKKEAEEQAKKEAEEQAKKEAEEQAKKETEKQSTTVTVPAPETGSNLVWVPTNGGKKYHSRSGCSNMKNPHQVTKATAEANGFTPCGRCY